MRYVAASLGAVLIVFVGCLSRPELVIAALDGAGDAAVTGEQTPPGATTGTGSEEIPIEAPDAAALEACRQACGTVDGGTCDGATCVITCATTGACPSAMVCPPGVPCHVQCTAKQACRSVSCGDASACEIDCVGERACDGNVLSNSETSAIACNGKEACHGNVTCNGDTCAITCSVEGCKMDVVDCCATSCTVNGFDTACD
jgi:hypothetical protein